MKKNFLNKWSSKTGHILAILSIILLAGCNRQSKPVEEVQGPISKITGNIYDQNGNETPITGKVVVRDKIRPLSNYFNMELGHIKDGKLELSFPDLDGIEAANKFFKKIDLDLPQIKVEPQDTGWVLIDDSRVFFVATDEEIEGIFGGTTTKNYNLEYRDMLGVFNVMFAYFTKDAVIKGKGKYLGYYDYDIDINAQKGWNMIYVKESNSSRSMKSKEKELTDIKWIAAITR
jgi:hypothetical protein